MSKDKAGEVLAEQWWRIDTGWACGGVRTISGIVVETPPVFRQFKGQKIEELKKAYEVYEI